MFVLNHTHTHTHTVTHLKSLKSKNKAILTRYGKKIDVMSYSSCQRAILSKARKSGINQSWINRQ
uniref:Uncharacterized protein n=1 Tax=Octopus bimaculoides TaxID=37653 RepID=A0A0L8GE56_OCTBM